MRNLRLAFFPVLIWTLALLAIYGPLAMGVVGLPASDLTTGMYPYAVFQGRSYGQAGCRSGRRAVTAGTPLLRIHRVRCSIRCDC